MNVKEFTVDLPAETLDIPINFPQIKSIDLTPGNFTGQL